MTPRDGAAPATVVRHGCTAESVRATRTIVRARSARPVPERSDTMNLYQNRVSHELPPSRPNSLQLIRFAERQARESEVGTRVVILGGGFGGIYAALGLDKVTSVDLEVTLVNRDNFVLFTPLLS